MQDKKQLLYLIHLSKSKLFENKISIAFFIISVVAVIVVVFASGGVVADFDVISDFANDVAKVVSCCCYCCWCCCC